MGFFSFVKDAGEKLFGSSKPADTAAAPTPEELAATDATAAQAIKSRIEDMRLPIEDLRVEYKGSSETVTVWGTTPDQATREKVVLCCGNVAHVASVNDLMGVVAPEPESKWYTVVKGDNLSRISKEFYGTPNKYMVIFEANQPMLTHPDKIYPGQMLRIPPLA
ncbi:MAG: peptidoglycan-binding protein LysM [Pseudomonadota bacterium]|jgi:nucleoid-associated protein YgaU